MRNDCFFEPVPERGVPRCVCGSKRVTVWRPSRWIARLRFICLCSGSGSDGAVVELIKLNGAKSFISSVFSCMIKSPAHGLSSLHRSNAERQRKLHLWHGFTKEPIIFSEKGKKKTNTALFSDSHGHKCPFERGNTSYHVEWLGKDAELQWTYSIDEPQRPELWERAWRNWVLHVMWAFKKKTCTCALKRIIQRVRDRVDYGYLGMPVVHSCFILFYYPPVYLCYSNDPHPS